MVDLSEQLADATAATFPQWCPGSRIAHTNGCGLHGWFQPSGALAELTSADPLAGSDPVPVTVRFSNGSGNRQRQLTG